MEGLRIQRQSLSSDIYLMNPVSGTLRATISLSCPKFRCFCALACSSLTTSQDPLRGGNCKKSVRRDSGIVRARVSDAQLKENWLDSLTSPFPDKSFEQGDGRPSNVGSSEWVIGIDPDLSGALALLKTDDSGCCAQVFDSPFLRVSVGKRIRRRLDVKSIVQLVQSFNAPTGTTAYIEQSIPYPQDGKQGWWSGGFGYGLWIGILVASGFSVVPVPSVAWKIEFNLYGKGSCKDDSREVASTLFPSMSSLLRRKKDHGRAEALLIAAYGKGLKLSSDSSCTMKK